MPADLDRVSARYLDHLGEADLRRLAATDDPGANRWTAGDLRVAPGRILELLARPATYDALLAPARDRREVAVVSPFLVFAAAVQRAAVEVERTGRVPEWTGPRARLPLFLDEDARAFVADQGQRLFLTELLASFASVAGGSYLTRSRDGWRRRRWSELDPVRLAGLLEAVPATQRSGIYRRLGDVALFLSGVFPDATSARPLGAVDAARLLRGIGERTPDGTGAGQVALLEHLGPRWYRLAVDTAVAPTAQTSALSAVADRFADARRLLTLVADRYLFPAGEPWFAQPGS